MSVADPNRTILTGENPFIRLSGKDGDPNSTDASFWRIIHCPMGPGHVLYVKSELTEGRWRIYSDNIAMARWLQKTVQGMLNPELKDVTIAVTDASFSKSGDPRYFWTERIAARGEDISLTWHSSTSISSKSLILSGRNSKGPVTNWHSLSITRT